jgi:hypothetical protein
MFPNRSLKVGDGQEDQPRHQLHGIARRPVFARFLVVLFVEPSDQFFEDRPHSVVVQAGLLHRDLSARRDRAGVQAGIEECPELDQFIGARRHAP